MAKKEPSLKEKLNRLFESLSPSIGGSTVFPEPTHLDPKSLAKTKDDRIENEYSDEYAKRRRAVLDPAHTFVPTDMFGTKPDTGMPSSVGIIGDTPPRSNSFIPGRSEKIAPSIDYNASSFDDAGKSEDDEKAAPMMREFDYLACVQCKTKPCSCKRIPNDKSGQSTFGGYDSKLDPKGSRNKWWHSVDELSETPIRGRHGLIENYDAYDEIEKQEKQRILKNENTWDAYDYAVRTIKGRWPEAEEFIKKNTDCALLYARDVIKGRWPEAEEKIKKYPWVSYLYAENIIKGRWPEAENAIIKHPEAAYYYATNIIKRRWPEAEEHIQKTRYYWKLYLEKICPECKGDGVISLGIGGAEEECVKCSGSGFDPNKMSF